MISPVLCTVKRKPLRQQTAYVVIGCAILPYDVRIPISSCAIWRSWIRRQRGSSFTRAERARLDEEGTAFSLSTRRLREVDASVISTLILMSGCATPPLASHQRNSHCEQTSRSRFQKGAFHHFLRILLLPFEYLSVSRSAFKLLLLSRRGEFRLRSLQRER